MKILETNIRDAVNTWLDNTEYMYWKDAQEEAKTLLTFIATGDIEHAVGLTQESLNMVLVAIKAGKLEEVETLAVSLKWKVRTEQKMLSALENF